jgi:cytochrome c
MRAVAVGLATATIVMGIGWGLIAPADAAYEPSDEWQGLPPGDGRETLCLNCIACHSTAVIQQQRLNRRVWNDVLQRMLEDMGWSAPSDDDYALILDYLVEHFGQDVPR